MKFISLFMLIILMSSFSNCSNQVKYESDIGLMSAQAAGVLESPVFINGFKCQDISGKFGACSISVNDRTSIKFLMPLTAYNYILTLTCSSNVGIDRNYSVLANTNFSFDITPDDYKEETSFTCIGRTTPDDDRDFISNKFELRVRIHSGKYLKRSQVGVINLKGRTFLNFGKHAYSVWIHDGDNWSHFKKTPMVEIKGDINTYKGYSESEIMRFNYYNL